MIEEDISGLQSEVFDLKNRVAALEDFIKGRKYKKTALAKTLNVGDVILWGDELVEVVETDHNEWGYDTSVKLSNGRVWEYQYYSEARVYEKE